MGILFKLIFRGNALVTWIQGRVTPKQFIIFGAILIGLTAGLVAVLLKLFVHWLIVYIGVISSNRQIITAVFPFVGISLCALYVFYLNRGKLGKGLSNILFAIAKKFSCCDLHKRVIKISSKKCIIPDKRMKSKYSQKRVSKIQFTNN